MNGGTSLTEDLQELLMQAVSLHQQGQIDAAAAMYQRILRQQSNHFDAMHLLGVTSLQREDFAGAQRLITSALAINPLDSAAIGNLGTSYLRNGQVELALLWLEIALKLQPGSVSAAINVATALDLDGRHGAAIAVLQSLPIAESGSYDAHNLLGLCLIKAGRPDEAAAAFQAAMKVDPSRLEGWANLAAALETCGQHAKARELAKKTRGHRPQFGGELESATAAAQRSVADTPSVPMLIASVNVLLANGLNDDAIFQLRRALSIETDNLMVRWLMAIAVLKAVYRSDAEMSESRQAFSRSLDEIKTWYEAAPALGTAHGVVGTIQPFYLVYQPYNNRELLSRYGALCASWMATFPGRQSTVHSAATGTNARLRLGIVSSHIREHSVWAAITKGWVRHLDRSKIDLHIFHLNETVDAETEEARRSVSKFDNRRNDLAGWINAITRAELDGLIYPEIGMDPNTLKLAALRLAPWQAVTWGHPETSALPTIDVFISSDLMEPADAAANYTEKLVCLPNLGVYCEPLAPESSDPDISALHLPRDEPLLLCPGSPFKYAPIYDDVWVQIAKGLRKKLFRRNTGGRLVFFRSQSTILDRTLENRLRAAFVAGGVDFDARVSIIPYLGRAQFFGLMRLSSLMLDTLGFSGFNTALQAAEGGLPMLTFDGGFLRGRLASGVMRRLDLPELIATTPEEFTAKALELIAAPQRLQDLRQKIIDRRKVLFRDLEPVRALEQFLLEEVHRSRNPV